MSPRRFLPASWAPSLVGMPAPVLFFAAAAAAVTVTNRNAEYTYTNEPVRLQTDAHLACDGGVAVSTLAGAAIPTQQDGGVLWGAVTLAPGEVADIAVRCDAPAAPAAPFVTVARRGDSWVMANARTTLTLPAAGAAPPLTSVTVGGAAVGSSRWNTSAPPASLNATAEATGPLFGRVRLAYGFPSGATLDVAFTLATDQPFATVDERFTGGADEAWVLDLSAGLGADTAAVWQTHTCDTSTRESPAMSGGTPPAGPLDRLPLRPSARWGGTLGYLFYRWNQGCDEKWIVGAANTKKNEVLAVAAVRGGEWNWPLGAGFAFSELGRRLPTPVVDDSGSYLAVRLPLWAPASSKAPGRRVYMLISGALDATGDASIPRVAKWHGNLPLDKLVNDYILDWPGVVAPNATTKLAFFPDSSSNPTSSIRGKARGIAKNLGKGQPPPAALSTLAEFNTYMDPDWYGFYFGHVSPENNNFATDFLRVPLLLSTGLQAHPAAKRINKIAQQAAEMDLFYSVTLPSGASQESPGYMGHAMDAWLPDAAYHKKYNGFDLLKNPRIEAALAFVHKVSHPFAWQLAVGALAGDPSTYAGRCIHPLGDTHNCGSVNYTKIDGVAAYAPPSPASLKTEELAGFGAVLRSHPGTASETFLALKAGPNRGHNHGDQLSIHYAAYGARHAVDLTFGYNPRPLQEWWHSRVTFSVGDDLQNMDGFERLVAFRASAAVDVAVGEVASARLRTLPDTPTHDQGTGSPVPYAWAANYPYTSLPSDLTYRRTVALVKSASPKRRDYVVMRDEHWGPVPLNVQYNSWYPQVDEVAKLLGPAQPGYATVDLGNSTLFAGSTNQTQPLGSFQTTRWTGQSEGNELATGVRLSLRQAMSSSIVSVLYPSGTLTAAAAPVPTIALAGSTVSVTFPDGADTVAFADSGALLSLNGKAALSDGDIDPARDQGKVGLTLLDAGYDFGPVPDWLIEQRSAESLYDWPLNTAFPPDQRPH